MPATRRALSVAIALALLAACGAAPVSREPPFPSAALDPPPYVPPATAAGRVETSDRAETGSAGVVVLPGARTVVRERLAWFARTLAAGQPDVLRRGFAAQVVLINRRRVVGRDEAVEHVRRGAAELRQLGVDLDAFFDVAHAGTQRAGSYFGLTVPQPRPEGIHPQDFVTFAPVRPEAIVAPTFPGVMAGLGNLSLVLAMRFDGDDLRIVGVAP